MTKSSIISCLSIESEALPFWAGYNVVVFFVLQPCGDGVMICRPVSCTAGSGLRDAILSLARYGL